MPLRDTILKESHKLFYERGFHDSGVELLSKRAGTTKRTLYAYFGNKEGLIEEVLRYRHSIFMTQLRDYFNKYEIKETADIVACYLAFLKDWTTSIAFYGCMFINACAEYSDVQSSPHQIAKQHKTEVRKWLFDSFEKINANNAKQKSDILFLFGEGIIVSAQTLQEFSHLDMEEIIKILN
ncbi:TetR/AcrR family transcriptional regulator [Psychrobacter sp. B38]|uniref:TetR/AcrR family transcriptional regulator n=1 Tax=Psychrobacter sp. B38 TaxID=3143538 RepID=UPI00320DFFF4